MAQNININRSVQDPYYRYKMPRIIAKVEGKGNGIKTVIANMPEIAKALARPPTYPTKYFGCELGAQTHFDLKNDRYIVNGEHDANKLQDTLDGFVRKFVLCPACDNPETTLTVKRSQTIHSKCKACGHSFIIDPKHKLSTFIIKNPPPRESGDSGDEKKDKKENGSPTEENGGTDFPDVPLVNGNSADEDDDDWAPEPTEAEAQQLSAQIGKLVLDKDLEKPVEDRLDMLHHYFIKAKEDDTIQDWKKILNEAERLELKTKAPLLLADVIFDTNVVAQIKEYRALLLRFTVNDKKAQRHLLGGIEQLIHAQKDTLLPKAAHILKALYDNDICDEETILAWGAKPSSKYVKKEFAKQIIDVCKPVLDWLQEADEESEDSEEDEADVQFDDRARTIGSVAAEPAKVNGHAAPKAKAAVAPAAVKDENGEEIDIDDI
ncbi:eukaryotic translation initiation factor 5 [Aphelenchoides avenae]|nr:eukaryotic translation initiation factor 5 [Aphelenchus avenae]